MTVAVLGSNGMTVDNIEKFMPADTTDIAAGIENDIDDSARTYANSHMIGVTLFTPLYDINGRELPLKRTKVYDKILRYGNSFLE